MFDPNNFNKKFIKKYLRSVVVSPVLKEVISWRLSLTRWGLKIYDELRNIKGIKFNILLLPLTKNKIEERDAAICK